MELFYIFMFIAIIAVYFFFFNGQKKQNKKASPDKSGKALKDLHIENVDVGGVIELRGVGELIEDFDVVVKAKHTYEEDGFYWYELECDKGGETVWIEIERDDALEVSLCQKKLKLQDIGLTAEVLKQIERKDGGKVSYNNRAFEYEDCGKATFYRNGEKARGEALSYWDFESEDEQHFITVELWGSNEYVVFYSESLRLSQIRVYSLADDNDS